MINDEIFNIGLVSIIMPSYNCENIIKKSIDSVLKQTYKNWELIIVDDCSTDNTESVIKEYASKHSNIYFFKLEHNSGAAEARNKAISESKGEYIAFLDSDDSWYTEKLEKQIKFMKNNSIDFCATGYELVSEDGTSLNRALIPPAKTNYNQFIMYSCPIGNLTAIYNRGKLGKIFVPNIKKRNDFALWLQVLKKTEFCYGMSDILAKYTIGRQGSLSKNKLKLLKYHWYLYRNIENHNILRSSIEVLMWAVVKVFGLGRKSKRIIK